MQSIVPLLKKAGNNGYGMASTYKCARCKQKVEIDVNVRCPYCGHRILFKERGAAIKELKAR